MDTNALIRQLTQERDRIDQAIKLLSDIGSTVNGSKAATGKRRKKRAPLSAEARARIAAAQRKRWAVARNK
jgi:hypothetical protein